jgi:hypothetical protein
LVKGFLAEKKVTTPEHPHTLLIWIKLIFNCSLHWNQHRWDGDVVVLLTSLRIRRKKAFINWLPGTFPTLLQSMTKPYSCTSGPFWRKCSLNECSFLCLSEIKVTPLTSWSYHTYSWNNSK